MIKTNTPNVVSKYLKEYFLTKIGNNTVTGSMFASLNNTFNIGDNTRVFGSVHSNILNGNPSLDIKVSLTSKLLLESNRISTTANFGINKVPTVPLDVNTSGTNTINANIGGDTDIITSIGRGKMGYFGVTGEFGLAHFDHLSTTNYLIKQNSAGDSFLNVVTGRTGAFNVNNSNIFTYTSSGFNLATSKYLSSVSFNSTTIPISGFRLNEIASNKYGLTINTIVADELRVKIFVADAMRVDMGDEWWGKGYGIIETEFTTPSAIGNNGVEVWFENNPAFSAGIFSDGDYILLRDVLIGTGLSVTNIWGQVYSSSAGGIGGYLFEQTPTNSANRQRWRFVLRNGSASYVIKKGNTAINFGASGQSYIHLSTVDAAGAPYIAFGRWTGADPYSGTQDTEVIIGKINAISGPVGSVGLYGKYNSSSFEISDAGALLKNIPIQVFNGANQTFNLSSIGTDFWIGVSSGDKRLTWNGSVLAITGTVTANLGVIGGWTIAATTLSASGLTLNSSTVKMSVGAAVTWQSDGIQLEYNAGNPRFYVGDGGVLSTDRYFMYDGTTISWRAANTTLDTSGNLTATNATLSGTITATLGAIGGWTIGATTLSATNLILTSGTSGTANITVGTGTSSAGINSTNMDTSVAFWAGQTHASRESAPFKVYPDGKMHATSGSIGGWVISSTSIASVGIALNDSNVANTANIFVGTGANGGGIAASDATTTNVILWAGQTFASRASAPFRVTAAGAITATSATITGAITASSGSLTGFLSLGASGGIYQGSGTAASPTTGLKIWNDSGTGRIAGYNAGVIQWYANTDGKLYAGGGTVLMDAAGLTLTTSDTTEYLRHGTGASEVTRYLSNTDLVGNGSGNYEIKTRPLNETFDGIAEAKLSVTNPSWTTQSSLGVYRDVYGLQYGYSTDRFLIGGSGNYPTNNLSGLVSQTTSISSSISLTNTSWGYSAHIGFNAYQANSSISYLASGAFKFLGAQFTGNVTAPGMLSFDGNANLFRFSIGETGLASGADITTWTTKVIISTTGLGIGNTPAYALDVTGSSRFSSNVGFYGTTPIARPAAYTQTYATATRTHSNLTSAALTDSSGGTADTTVQSIGTTYSQTEVRNNFADLTAQINALRTDLANAKQIINSLTNDLQAFGLLQ